LIPSGSLQDVLVLKSDKSNLKSGDQAVVEKRRVQIGSRNSGQVEITSGLEAGEYVITHGTMNARAGKKVRILAKQQDGEGIKKVLERLKNKK
jgi:membrane fusion protein (multidrug efflux system)